MAIARSRKISIIPAHVHCIPLIVLNSVHDIPVHGMCNMFITCLTSMSVGKGCFYQCDISDLYTLIRLEVYNNGAVHDKYMYVIVDCGCVDQGGWGEHSPTSSSDPISSFSISMLHIDKRERGLGDKAKGEFTGRKKDF